MGNLTLEIGCDPVFTSSTDFKYGRMMLQVFDCCFSQCLFAIHLDMRPRKCLRQSLAVAGWGGVASRLFPGCTQTSLYRARSGRSLLFHHILFTL